MDTKEIDNPFLPITQSAILHSNDHLPRIQRSFVHFSALYEGDDEDNSDGDEDDEDGDETMRTTTRTATPPPHTCNNDDDDDDDNLTEGCRCRCMPAAQWGAHHHPPAMTTTVITLSPPPLSPTLNQRRQ